MRCLRLREYHEGQLALRSDRRRHDDGPPPATPYYAVTFLIGEPGPPAENRFTMYYVPSRHVVAADGIEPGALSWFPVVGAVANRWVARTTAGLTPFPAPRRWPHTIQSPRKLMREAAGKVDARRPRSPARMHP